MLKFTKPVAIFTVSCETLQYFHLTLLGLLLLPKYVSQQVSQGVMSD
jgi:hypothetical protein